MSNSVGIAIAGMFVMIALGCVGLMFMIRFTSKDKVLCTFHKNHKKGTLLLKYDVINMCVWIGRENDPNRERYDVIEDCIEWCEYPGMLPSIFCVPIRSLDYVRGVPTPMHPEKKVNANASAKMNRLQSDTNVLQAVYLHARQSLGIATAKSKATLVLMMLIGVILLSLFGVYKSMQTSSDIKGLKMQVQTITNGLGFETTPPITPTPAPSTAPLIEGGK